MRGTASAVTTVREANFIVVAAQKGDSMEWIDLMGGGGDAPLQPLRKCY